MSVIGTEDREFESRRITYWNKKINVALAAWPSGIVSVCHRVDRSYGS
jgi:hypothetical protein